MTEYKGDLTGEAYRKQIQEISRKQRIGKPIIEPHPGHAPTGLPEDATIVDPFNEWRSMVYDRTIKECFA